MSCSAFRDGPRHGGLGPMGSLEIEDDDVGEVGSVLVLATKNKQFVALVQGCGMAWK